jgi:guanylate kinase
MPPSLEVLEQRLRSRGTNDDRDIALRLENARAEIDAANEFDYVIVNNKLDDAVADMQAIIRAERCRNPH